MAKKEFEKEQEMSSEQAKAYRASLYKEPKVVLSEASRRQQFKMFWARSRKRYNASKELEPILWIHLKATGNDQPENFEGGVAHFGLKKIR